MKSFEDNRILRQSLAPSLLSTVRVIGEYKGKQDLWRERFPEILKRLQEVAIIQSATSAWSGSLRIPSTRTTTL
jgi:hypothetical protein